MNRFVIADPRRCIGCNTCMAACTMVHRAEGLQSLPRLTVTRTLEVTAPTVCRNCEDAPCGRVCPADAIWIADGRVVLDEQRCIGCKMCALACPFGAITPAGTSISGVAGLRIDQPEHPAGLDPLLAWDIGVRTVAVKCDLCSFRAEGPACIRACPTAALREVNAQALNDESNVKRQISAATATVPERDPGLKPSWGAAAPPPPVATGECD
ncbi:hydrogenase 4 component A (plasmid) [Rhodovastum atsumiense]|uniref:4Fe-4S dicluster domain-containing protein n=1 Tax=Rhodovastum atsumiense TaxID=504468 RepID=UPI002024C200|nr:4Fe-4S dicluster domain-containing protein [Rhodovastum atsumiense]CAH2605558.1 hydrogenase 4 component A [Rhodovastum atsumiense]